MNMPRDIDIHLTHLPVPKNVVKPNSSANDDDDDDRISKSQRRLTFPLEDQSWHSDTNQITVLTNCLADYGLIYLTHTLENPLIKCPSLSAPPSNKRLVQ